MYRRAFLYGLFGIFAAVLSGFLSLSAALAAPVTVPTELSPGEQYRLAFVTSTLRDATSSDIADYNAFVQGVADSQAELAALGATWTAIASTATVDARDNVAEPDLVRIYLLNDTKLANDDEDLFTGAIHEAPNITEAGSVFNTNVWTGTDASGFGVPGQTLGSGLVEFGHSADSGSFGDWLSFGVGFDIEVLPFYAISSVLTVEAPIVVPAPGAAGLFVVALLVFAHTRRTVG
ncbi:MAG: PEP-CTERM sorting domain-containing protein [Alphaproteobacteria bacterium]|jgi:hypothetical protein|nr:PEP-CTERM sorting domain-containing protein [Alphaproteobacteria bacterium]MDP6814388.1 PEP-CTERM sorting domain-containing protein [Alphaproteobacteria bacterium]